MGERSQVRARLSGMLQEGRPAPSQALPLKRAVQRYLRSAKAPGVRGVTPSPGFKAVLM